MDADAGKDWGQKEKGMADMVRWHHWLNGHEFKQTLGDSEGQGSLVCCSPWGPKDPDMTEQLNTRIAAFSLFPSYQLLCFLQHRATCLFFKPTPEFPRWSQPLLLSPLFSVLFKWLVYSFSEFIGSLLCAQHPDPSPYGIQSLAKPEDIGSNLSIHMSGAMMEMYKGYRRPLRESTCQGVDGEVAMAFWRSWALK